ncbi:MAG: aminoacyl-tRNA hydrolase [Candidatus Eremiobacteraeota bacterium]|nr:aminoacyl-tRNA hydrolase [Candidatus Eremiobacteraeota bacterium]
MSGILIAGLGNPGLQYARTYHNTGYMVVDGLRHKLGFPPWKKRKFMKISQGSLCDKEIIIIKPTTYMNLSGSAILSCFTKYKATNSDMLVVVDDMALPFGKIRFRARGSDGGHNGLASIIEKIGTSEFPRLRVGINAPPGEVTTTDYVLSNFTPDELKTIKKIFNRSIEGIMVFIEEGIIEAMNKFN